MTKYYNPVRLFFGEQQLNNLVDIVQSCGGKNILLLTGLQSLKKSGYFVKILNILSEYDVSVFSEIPSNPDVANIAKIKNETDSLSYDLVLAVGGGSVIDAGKALVALRGVEIKSPEDIRNVIREKRYGAMECPLIAVPTTAGTGSEVTSWATVWDREAEAKYSIEDAALYPRAAIVAPELTVNLNGYMTAASALDALSHATEAYWSKNTNEIVRMYATKAINCITKNLDMLLDNLGDINLRTKVANGSLFAGLAFSNTKTTACHSISYPLTLKYGLNHGVAVSMTLGKMLAMNEDSLIEKEQFFAAYGVSSAEEVEVFIQKIYKKAGILSRLRHHGASRTELAGIADKSFTPGRMDNNPVDLNKQDILRLLEDIY
ncbi:phosphonoacetaldehyde reductase [Dethiobacter alkaliphilus]|uniref:phosphonoacetaldehyde reductase n=1 Tax=Dethiobacter alkaliphilus TaxID=427926 RepID=UPI002227E7A2|nr:phosphonoacetaldehyde reductase [Dethiobacter alkaliphilus]MCW3488829.1 phosphonoacetaldehyde reductase [Dethiobacter alkaliphilus]